MVSPSSFDVSLDPGFAVDRFIWKVTGELLAVLYVWQGFFAVLCGVGIACFPTVLLSLTSFLLSFFVSEMILRQDRCADFWGCRSSDASVHLDVLCVIRGDSCLGAFPCIKNSVCNFPCY